MPCDSNKPSSKTNEISIQPTTNTPTSNEPSSSKAHDISSHSTTKNFKKKEETKEKKTTAEIQITEHRQEMQVFYKNLIEKMEENTEQQKKGMSCKAKVTIFKKNSTNY